MTPAEQRRWESTVLNCADCARRADTVCPAHAGPATIDQLQRFIRDAGLSPNTPLVIQAFGKATKFYSWELDYVGGELVIRADLCARKRPLKGGLP